MSIKLSNQQVHALAQKIADDFKVSYILPVRAGNIAITKSKDYVDFFTTDNDCITIMEMTEVYANVTKRYCENICEEIRGEVFDSMFVDEPSIKLSDIEREIYLATINATDLDSLIALVATKFIK